MPKGKAASKQQQGEHSPAAPTIPETAAAAASPEPPGDLTDSQELAAAIERLTSKVGAVTEEICGEFRAQVQPIASMLQKQEQDIQGLRERAGGGGGSD
ncbi:hypothetical protein chiPu_0003308 [Chiloscyllium punctatum]|uniref:Uncharacterized protein n=1 Tax=Chiloscyllium punctatum TaxID=137246 RepID=A0A401S3B1_CHIPU|nr:hypothetical protein [Chiloscyllium punctatum]